MLGISVAGFAVMAAGSVCFLLWLLLYARGMKHNAMFEVLDAKDYPLKDIYGLGYGALELVHYKYQHKKDRELRQKLEVLYGEKYCEYYLRAVRSQQVTLASCMFVLSFAFYGLTASPAAMLIGFLFTWAAAYYYGREPAKKIDERSAAMLHDFSDVVSKLALLTNAGMILKGAWEEVAYEGEGVIYTEMRRAVDEMNNGVAEVDAIYNFGMRCVIPEIKKFTSTIVQGITKGSSELTIMLQEQSKEVWQLKKQLVRREAEKAANKLLLPLCIMFLGILIMIVVPIFSNIGVT